LRACVYVMQYHINPKPVTCTVIRNV